MSNYPPGVGRNRRRLHFHARGCQLVNNSLRIGIVRDRSSRQTKSHRRVKAIGKREWAAEKIAGVVVAPPRLVPNRLGAWSPPSGRGPESDVPPRSGHGRAALSRPRFPKGDTDAAHSSPGLNGGSLSADTPATCLRRYGFMPSTLGSGLSGDSGMPPKSG